MQVCVYVCVCKGCFCPPLEVEGSGVSLPGGAAGNRQKRIFANISCSKVKIRVFVCVARSELHVQCCLDVFLAAVFLQEVAMLLKCYK